MGAKKTQKQSRTTYRVRVNKRRRTVHSITVEEIPLTSRYERVTDIEQLSQGDVYYWRGLNGRLSHSCVFDLDEPTINYVEVVAKQIARGIIYRQKPKKEKSEKGNETTLALFK